MVLMQPVVALSHVMIPVQYAHFMQPAALRLPRQNVVIYPGDYMQYMFLRSAVWSLVWLTH